MKTVCLGIESTSHTFGIGIVDDNGRILSNEKDVYKPPLGKGIIPTEAASHHREVAKRILQNALKSAGIDINEIDFISYSAGPGLPPALIAGAKFAFNLAKKNKKGLIPVNHPVAHLEIGKLTTKVKDPIFLYLSGGNTQIIAYTGGRYRIFGETLDIPIGNALDVLAREIGLAMPGGPEIEKLAKSGRYVKLPYVIKGMDLSFSGILTHAVQKLKRGISKNSVAFSMQETCFAMLTEATERALAHTEKNEVLLIGGVASNKRLQEMLRIMCKERGAEVFVVPDEYAADNGAMIAWAGMLAYKSKWKSRDLAKNKINSKWRIDQVEITWV